MCAERRAAKSSGFQPLAEGYIIKFPFQHQMHSCAFRYRLCPPTELIDNLILEALPLVPVELAHAPEMTRELTTLNKFGDGGLGKERRLATADLLCPEQGFDHRFRDHQIADAQCW